MKGPGSKELHVVYVYEKKTKTITFAKVAISGFIQLIHGCYISSTTSGEANPLFQDHNRSQCS